MEVIRNKVEESGLIQLDLAEFKPSLTIEEIDLAPCLWQGLVLREKEFRSWIKENDWTLYQDSAAFIHCSTEAIIPSWAFMLVSIELTRVNCLHLVGSKSDLEKALITEKISKLEIEPYFNGKLIIKGCSDIANPAYAMTELLKRLQPIAKSIMYGEPCSTVPLYKRK